MFVDDVNANTDYVAHQNTYHKNRMTSEEFLFEDFRKKMIKQKDDYEKSKEEAGDSDLVFNAKEGDAYCQN